MGFGLKGDFKQGKEFEFLQDFDHTAKQGGLKPTLHTECWGQNSIVLLAEANFGLIVQGP